MGHHRPSSDSSTAFTAENHDEVLILGIFKNHLSPSISILLVQLAVEQGPECLGVLPESSEVKGDYMRKERLFESGSNFNEVKNLISLN